MLVKANFKMLLRFAILGGTLFFLAKVLRENWEGVATIRLSAGSWLILMGALTITLWAHMCAGWVWSLILKREFRQLIQTIPIIRGYLQSTIAKYLPGNIWHYYGRIKAATESGASLETATVSTLLEPLLMAAAALIVALVSGQTIAAKIGAIAITGQVLALGGVLLSLHPICLNRLLKLVSKLKQSKRNPTNTADQTGSTKDSATLLRYPASPLAGELTFLLLRGGGFLLTFWALSPFQLPQLPMLLSTFSLSWLLGLVIPGAPGGIGVFEATAIALLKDHFPVGLLLGIVAFYRLISVLAEALGAGLSWIAGRLPR